MKRIFFVMILFSLFACALCAEVTVGATLEFSTDAFRVYRNKADDDPSYGAFSTFDFGDTAFFVDVSGERFGARVTLKPAHETATAFTDTGKWWFAWFDDTYAWVKPLAFSRPFPIELQFQVGEFQRRRMRRFDSILNGNHYYGYVWYGNTDTTPVTRLSALKDVETDVMEHFIVDLRVGPVLLEYSPIALNVVDSNSGIVDIDPKSTKTMTRGGLIKFVQSFAISDKATNPINRNFLSRARVSTAEPIDIFGWTLDASAWYAIAYYFRDGEYPSGSTSGVITLDDNNSYRMNYMLHRYGLVVDVDAPLDFGFALAYSGSIFSQKHEWLSGTKSALTDWTHAVELRANYRGLANIGLLFEARNKAVFAQNVGERLPATYAGSTTTRAYPSFLFVQNSVDAAWQFHGRMALLCALDNRFVRFFGDETTGAWFCEDEFSIKPLFRYYLRENAWIQTGVEFKYNMTWQSGDVEDDWRWDVIIPFKIDVRY